MEHPQAAGLAAAPRRLCCLLFQVAKLIQMAIEEDAALHGCNIISASPSRSGLKWRGALRPAFLAPAQEDIISCVMQVIFD